jgi:hypothetical protein
MSKRSCLSVLEQNSGSAPRLLSLQAKDGSDTACMAYFLHGFAQGIMDIITAKSARSLIGNFRAYFSRRATLVPAAMG